MRSAKELIEEIRFNTNNIDENRFTDAAIIRFLNSGIRQIQRVIFTSNPTTQVFSKTKSYIYDSSTNRYKLPSDIYAINATYGLYPIRQDGQQRESIPLIIEKEAILKTGYYVKDKHFFLSSGFQGTSIATFDLVYVKRVPSLNGVDETPDLPETVEDFLVAFAERKIHYVDSSKSVVESNVLTNEEKQDIKDLFMDNTKEIKYPPVTDETYITY